ncbi:alpha-amylase family glycosyl hydrolase [uncultured Sphaerochaeta sp.]|uniref:alpha-amylase family glycosyl hydrolase n=1 Tax=uncultured Sphaerochaeta sp. TaxID=886478 RepID=UPI002A0A522A|nr:alpha-amylase family glycosyl hydrolase [uncultured Sphaerochaeta sp.]
MPKWLENSVFYEIYPQSFNDTNGDGIGDINGITEKLDYIKDLGCNAIWVNPCFDSPFMDAGYDVRDYKKVAPRYGTNEDLVRCFSEAHKRDMHILLDLVPGHTSDTHPWFLESKKACKNEFTNRFIWTDSAWNRSVGFSSISGMSERNGCYILNFFASQPALNYGFNTITESWQLPYTHPDCIATRNAMKDVMRFWLALGCDGFRVDMARSLVKNDAQYQATCEVWRDILDDVRKDYPQMAAISEWSDPPLALDEAGFDMDFYLNQEGNGYHALFRKTDESFFSKEGKGDAMPFVEEYLGWYEKSKDHGYISLLTCNHDTPRLTKAYDSTELKLAYAFVFTMPGIPFLYYGDEIGMQYVNLVSVEGGYERTGTRTPMQWNSGKPNQGFSEAPASALYLPVDQRKNAPTVENQELDKTSLLHFVREIISIRRANPDLGSTANLEFLYAKSHEYPLVYRRGNFVICLNPGKKDVTIALSVEGRPLYSLGRSVLQNGHLFMGGQSFVIFDTQKD